MINVGDILRNMSDVPAYTTLLDSTGCKWLRVTDGAIQNPHDKLNRSFWADIELPSAYALHGPLTVLGLPIIVLVTGGRNFARLDIAKDEPGLSPEEEEKLLFDTLDGIHQVTFIKALRHGGANGADAAASRWVANSGAGVLATVLTIYKAQWKAYGKAAGHMRNTEMLEDGETDIVVAFPGGNGTADMVRKAKAAGVSVLEVSSDKPHTLTPTRIINKERIVKGL